jgi:hypothetical protein
MEPDHRVEVEQARLAAELARAKVHVVLEEHRASEAKLTRRIVELESQLAERTEQLRSYTELVDDLDVVLMSSGEAELTGTARAFSEDQSGAAERVKRSLQMSREIVELKKELASAAGRCERAETALGHTRAELDEARESLRTFSGERPNNFLARRLMMKGEELEALQERERATATQRDSLAEENRELRAELTQAEASFAQINQLRAALDTLQSRVDSAEQSQPPTHRRQRKATEQGTGTWNASSSKSLYDAKTVTRETSRTGTIGGRKPGSTITISRTAHNRQKS